MEPDARTAIDAIVNLALEISRASQQQGLYKVTRQLFLKFQMVYAPKPVRSSMFVEYLVRTEEPLQWMLSHDPKLSFGFPYALARNNAEWRAQLFRGAGMVLDKNDDTLLATS